jgi:hypothetical protein
MEDAMKKTKTSEVTEVTVRFEECNDGELITLVYGGVSKGDEALNVLVQLVMGLYTGASNIGLNRENLDYVIEQTLNEMESSQKLGVTKPILLH